MAGSKNGEGAARKVHTVISDTFSVTSSIALLGTSASCGASSTDSGMSGSGPGDEDLLACLLAAAALAKLKAGLTVEL